MHLKAHGNKFNELARTGCLAVRTDAVGYLPTFLHRNPNIYMRDSRAGLVVDQISTSVQ